MSENDEKTVSLINATGELVEVDLPEGERRSLVAS